VHASEMPVEMKQHRAQPVGDIDGSYCHSGHWNSLYSLTN
jgi:hypothetical protein